MQFKIFVRKEFSLQVSKKIPRIWVNNAQKNGNPFDGMSAIRDNGNFSTNIYSFLIQIKHINKNHPFITRYFRMDLNFLWLFPFHPAERRTLFLWYHINFLFYCTRNSPDARIPHENSISQWFSEKISWRKFVCRWFFGRMTHLFALKILQLIQVLQSHIKYHGSTSESSIVIQSKDSSRTSMN